jgi:hypothetical protein
MNKNPMLLNCRPLRRRPFRARRGIALLRAWRLRLLEQPSDPYIQTQFSFTRVDPQLNRRAPAEAARIDRGSTAQHQNLS